MDPVFKRSVLATCVSLALQAISPATFAQYDVSLNRFFSLSVLEEGEKGDDPHSEPVDEVFSKFYLDSMGYASDYLMGMLAPYTAARYPVTIQIACYKQADDNAAASSLTVLQGKYSGYSELSAALMGNYFGDSGNAYDDAMAAIDINRGSGASQSGWYEGVMHNLSYGGEDGSLSDLTSTLIHEMSHALGIGSFADKRVELQDLDNGIVGFFGASGDTFNFFERGLRDLNGNAPLPGMQIRDKDSIGEDDGNSYFVTDKTGGSNCGVYFTGSHVQEVLNGALIATSSDANVSYIVPGLPVNGLEEMPNDDGSYILFPDFSHIELQNAQMSHQSYRNWNVLMEAELAVLQDSGVTFDRRNMFGYSVYNSGTADKRRSFVNNNPYYARTEDGQWLEGMSNATAYGIGLHVYGSYNDIVQKAQILSSGAYGIGIRVDGSSNGITVAKESRVSADGIGGIGLLFSYGKEQSAIVLGNVSALGEQGDAVRFDFGDNNLGNKTEYRGSYIRSSWNKDQDEFEDLELLPELKGALVDDFVAGGVIAGQGSAVTIAKNSYVKNIHIVNGAEIYGDIVSQWDPYNVLLQYNGSDELLTTVTFGEVFSAGKLFGADHDFFFSYDGNITGANSIVLNLLAGNTELNGKYEVRAVNIDEGAKLEGDAIFNLEGDSNQATRSLVQTYASINTAQGSFTNAGTVSPGGKARLGEISINGNYVGLDGSVLELEYNCVSNDVLKVSGNATLGAVKLSLDPVKDYYKNDFTRVIALNDLVQSGLLATSGSLSLNESAVSSPTLSSVATLSANEVTVGIKRKADAYSQYAEDPNSRSLGLALDSASNTASLGEIFKQLDFSDPSGREVNKALKQLQPSAHANAALGMLDHQQFLNNRGRLMLRNAVTTDEGTHAYADAYAMQLHRGHDLMKVGSGKNAGVTAGVDSHDHNRVLGMYLNANYRDGNTGNAASIKDTSLYLGLRGMTGLGEDESLKLFGDLRCGFDAVNYDKYVQIAEYSAKNSDDYLAFGASASLGFSKDFYLSQGLLGLSVFSDYALLRSPTVDEGNDVSALKLDSHVYDSLKLGVGLDFIGKKVKLSQGAYALNASLSYRRELFDDLGAVTARFKHAPDAAFAYRAEFSGKDSVSTSVGTSVYTDESGRSVISLNAGGEFFLGEGQEIFGQLGYSCRF